jgi:hypothetical protein
MPRYIESVGAVALALSLGALPATPAAAQSARVTLVRPPDAAGCQDHPRVPRLPGYTIQRCMPLPIGAHAFSVGNGGTTNVDGKLLVIRYRPPTGNDTPPSALEVLRAIEDAVTSTGGTLVSREPPLSTMRHANSGKELWIEASAGSRGEYTLTMVEKGARFGGSAGPAGRMPPPMPTRGAGGTGAGAKSTATVPAQGEDEPPPTPGATYTATYEGLRTVTNEEAGSYETIVERGTISIRVLRNSQLEGDGSGQASYESKNRRSRKSGQSSYTFTVAGQVTDGKVTLAVQSGPNPRLYNVTETFVNGRRPPEVVSEMIPQDMLLAMTNLVMVSGGAGKTFAAGPKLQHGGTANWDYDKLNRNTGARTVEKHTFTIK